MKILTIVKNDGTYRFTDVIKVDGHYIGRLIRDDNTVGKMEHRITQEEYESGTVSETEITLFN